MAKGPTITVNLDKICVECGKPGALKNAICLGCMVKVVSKAPMRSEVGRAIQRKVLASLSRA